MKTLCGPRSWAESTASLPPSARERLWRSSNGSQLASLKHDWGFWGRREQLAPNGDWRTWLFMGGRGAGKTRAGAEWVSALARRRKAGRIALVGPTFHDVREVMVEGNSGLRSLGRMRPAYEASRKRLVWANGAQAFCFSAEDPESLRGPQFDAAWCDELCFWAHPDETLATLEHGMRLGERPRMMVTTTPRPIAALKRLMAARDTVVTRSSTWENKGNVAADFIAALNERWAGTARHRQELMGELIEDFEGALWLRRDIEALRQRLDEPFDRVVVAVDPPVSAGANADTCGIIAAAAVGEGRARRAVVLADASVQGALPHVWAAKVAALAGTVGATSIVAEGNNGGELVRGVLQAAAPDCVVRIVHARFGKRARAEPIAALYAQGRVKHAAAFPALEDEMCAFGADGFAGSPDRVDALVWALTDLLLGGEGPRIRAL
ncbi:MAG: DNA-packaging protein [Phycisphaerales bacterium]|nr:DNA-packaging protein [Hyphomonadaceae bacterium]